MRVGIDRFLGLTALAAVLVGCSDGKPKMPTVEPKGDCLMSELPENAVFLKVNDRAFTRGEFEDTSRMFDMINRTRARHALTGPNPEAEHAIRVMGPGIVSEMRRRELLRQFAEKNKVEPTPADIAEVTTNLLVYLRRSERTIDAVATEFGEKHAGILRSYMKGDATDLALRRFVDVDNILNITEDDVIAASNRWKTLTATAIASNAVEKAILEKALAEIAAGGDFGDVAEKYSENPGDGKEWTDCDAEDLEGEEVDGASEFATWLKRAKVGDVSGILELDDGWSVIKVVALERDEDDFNEITWKLVRICRTLWELPPELDHDETVDGLREFRTKKIQKILGDKVLENAVIEWPHGTNLFKKASAKLKNPPIKPKN